MRQIVAHERQTAVPDFHGYAKRVTVADISQAARRHPAQLRCAKLSSFVTITEDDASA